MSVLRSQLANVVVTLRSGASVSSELSGGMVRRRRDLSAASSCAGHAGQKGYRPARSVTRGQYVQVKERHTDTRGSEPETLDSWEASSKGSPARRSRRSGNHGTHSAPSPRPPLLILDLVSPCTLTTPARRPQHGAMTTVDTPGVRQPVVCCAIRRPGLAVRRLAAHRPRESGDHAVVLAFAKPIKASGRAGIGCYFRPSCIRIVEHLLPLHRTGEKDSKGWCPGEFK